MDSLILAEAIATVMGYEEKELCKPGRLALAVMLSTATTVLGSKKRVIIQTLFLLFVTRHREND